MRPSVGPATCPTWSTAGVVGVGHPELREALATAATKAAATVMAAPFEAFAPDILTTLASPDSLSDPVEVVLHQRDRRPRIAHRRRGVQAVAHE